MSDCTLPNRYFDDCHGGLKWEHAYVGKKSERNTHQWQDTINRQKYDVITVYLAKSQLSLLNTDRGMYSDVLIWGHFILFSSY